MRKTSDKIALVDAHLRIITDSFYFSQLKDLKNPLIADKKKLIFKIIDKLKVSETISKKYLNILESRNLIEITQNAVYYNQQIFKKRGKEELIDIDKLLKNFKNDNRRKKQISRRKR